MLKMGQDSILQRGRDGLPQMGRDGILQVRRESILHVGRCFDESGVSSMASSVKVGLTGEKAKSRLIKYQLKSMLVIIPVGKILAGF